MTKIKDKAQDIIKKVIELGFKKLYYDLQFFILEHSILPSVTITLFKNYDLVRVVDDKHLVYEGDAKHDPHFIPILRDYLEEYAH